MIDLRNKGLPDAIEVDGKLIFLNTDFRIWLGFSEIIKNEDVTIYDIADVFKDNISIFDILEHQQEIYTKLMEFYVNPNSTPKLDDTSTDIVVDYIEDGEYIVASFLQAYNIDLTTCDMHWHMFKALFLGLPDNTKIKEIMSIRGWTKDDGKKYEEKAKHMKEIWKLPTKSNIKDIELLDEINDLFYNC